MAERTSIEPIIVKEPLEPDPTWDPTCPGCRSGFTPPPDPEDPIVLIAEPIPAETA